MVVSDTRQLKKIKAMTHDEKLFYLSGGYVTVGKVTQILDDRLKTSYVAKIRGVVVGNKDEYLHATSEGARKYGHEIQRHFCKEKVGAQQRGPGPFPKPRYVPKRVLLLTTVRSDFSLSPITASPGEYEAHCNQYGAVSVETEHGMLGVMLDEFEPIEWQKNPHLELTP